MKEKAFLTHVIASFFLLLPTLLATAGGNIPDDPWSFTAEDIYGGALTPGDTTYDPASDTYTVTADGHDIWDTADDFRYLYMEASGDFSISVCVSENPFQGGSSPLAKAGVMVRQDNTPGSPHVCQVSSRADGWSLRFRDSQDRLSGCGCAAFPPDMSFPSWVRIRREGDTWYGDYSFDGDTWQHHPASHHLQAMSDPILVGMCLTSHEPGVLTTARFTDFRLNGSGPVTEAVPGEDQWVYGGDSVTLDGSGSRKADTYYWAQVIVSDEPFVFLDNENPPDGITHFFSPSPLEVGVTLTFRLTVNGETGTDSAETHVNVRATNPPTLPPTNLRIQPIDRGFWLYWDAAFDAESYEIQIEYFPDIWVPVAPNVWKLQYELRDLVPGSKVAARVVGKNKHGRGPASEPVSCVIMRNLALPVAAGGVTPPSEYVYTVSQYDITGMNNGQFDDSNDSWNGQTKNEDFWGYMWEQPVYFDWVVYFIGEILYDGGWFTDLTVQYTEDGTTWKNVPNVQLTPAYDFTNSPAGRDDFARYDITFPTVRGTGIRIYGTPGGAATFTSIAELEVYGDQTRADLLAVRGIDAEFPENGTAILDGSESFSTRGDIISYHWEQVSGPTVSIQNSDDAIATFEAPQVDNDTVLVFSLTAGDGAEEATDSDVRITIKDMPTIRAEAGPDQTVGEGWHVMLDGSGSYNAATFQWTQIEGPCVTLSDPGSALCSFTAPEVWSLTRRLTFRLRVNDGVGGTDTDDVNVIVTNSLFDLNPLGPGYFQDLLHLGQTPADRFLAPLDQSLDANDYLANWGGQANVNPMEGEEYDFTDTGVTTTVNPMIWTPVHRDDGFFMHDLRAGLNLDNFGQIYHIYIFSPEGREARLHFRHDEELRIWNNGVLAASSDSWDLGTEQSQDFTLDEGINSMTLRFEEGGAGNHVAARITDRNDVPYTDLYYTLSIPNPPQQAFAVRNLPASYQPGTIVPVELSVRANPDNLPETITIRESIPDGVTVADAGGGNVSGGTITWILIGKASVNISYALKVPANTTAGLDFAGNVNGEDILGDNAVYAVPSAPLYVSLDMRLGARLVWSSPPEEGADTYRVERRLNGGDWQQVAITRETSYFDGAADDGTRYSYRVKATNTLGVEGPFSKPTQAKALAEIPIRREAEDFNYGGGLYPGYENCPVANEAPDSDTVGTPEEYDFFFETDIPEDDSRRLYRPLDNCAIETVEEADNPGVYHTNIGWITVGNWWRYTFDVPEPGPGARPEGWAMIGLRVGCPGGGTVELYWDEGLLGSISYDTDNWHIMRWYPLPGAFRTSPGEHTLRVKLASGGMTFDTIGIGFNMLVRRAAIFSEDFESYTKLYESDDLEDKGGWTVVNGSTEPLVGWRLWNTAGNYLGDETAERHPAIAGMTGNYVISDSDLQGTADLNEELVTPGIDCTDWIRLKLDFSKNFRVFQDDWDHSQIAELDIRVWDADRSRYGDWVNLVHFDVDSVDPLLDPAIDSSPETVELSAYDGEIFQLRWHFYDARWDWWWAIDNILLSGEPLPTPPPPKPTIAKDGDTVSLSWEEFGDGQYTAEWTNDLPNGIWQIPPGTWPIAAATWTDSDIAGSEAIRGFYRVESDGVYSDAVGFVKVFALEHGLTMLSVPLAPADNRLNGEIGCIGDMIKENLLGGPVASAADMLWKWDSATQTYNNAFLIAGCGEGYDGKWWDPSADGFSTLTLDVGEAFWILRR